MTDHIPNDLSHLSDEAFNALCPQGEHVPGSEPLSPAAQAVAWAYDNAPERPTGNHRYHWIAAALRAAADQVVPEKLESYGIRYELLRIADELEAHG